jgi:hypothetical protein
MKGQDFQSHRQKRFLNDFIAIDQKALENTQARVKYRKKYSRTSHNGTIAASNRLNTRGAK